MAGIQFQYTWHDDSKNAIRYTALGEWTWRDYHACVQIASFSLAGHEGIHSIIDFRQQTRPKMPGGMIAHMRTFGKKLYLLLVDMRLWWVCPKKPLRRYNATTMARWMLWMARFTL
jgi:hypothetical protein